MHDTSSSTAGQTPKPKRRRWIGWILLLLVLIGGGLVLSGRIDLPQADEAPETPVEAAGVTAEPRAMRLHVSEVYTVEPRDLSVAVEFTGTVRPSQRADISAQVSGIANAVHVQEGDAVSEGEVLVEIDASDLELQLRQQQSTRRSTQAQLAAAQQTLQRTRTLADRGLSPQSELDAATAEVDRLEATIASLDSQVEQVQANIARTQIRAPFAGTVAARTVEPGQVVSQGTILISIVDLDRMTVDALVPLARSASIRVGQTAEMSVQGLDATIFQATVDRISPIAVEGTRSTTVYLSLENPDARLRGGMFVTGEIVTDASADALAVPERALLGEQDAPSVMVIEDGELVEREVQIAQVWSRLNTVEIASGIEAGDVVVSMPLSGLEAGQAVIVEE